MRYIASKSMEEGMVLSRSIFDKNHKLLLNKDKPISNRYIKRIKELGYQGVYIADQISKGIEIHDIVDESLRLEAFNAVSDICDHAKKFAKDRKQYQGEINNHIQRAKDIIDRIIKDLRQRDIPQINMIDLKIFEDYIVSHNVNVGILSLYLGLELNLYPEDLRRLGLAGFLLDVGKLFIPDHILNKKDRLTDAEHEEINKHSLYSYDYLKTGFDVHPTTYLAVLHHHEKYDGTGYPKQKKGEEIPFFSRIIAIADVYDALTSKRPNRRALLPNEATEYMMANGATYFDMSLLKLFLKKVAPYPVGLEVELSNHSRGLVIKNNPDTPLRPLVRVFHDPRAAHLPYEVNLSDLEKWRNVTISSIGHRMKA